MPKLVQTPLRRLVRRDAMLVVAALALALWLLTAVPDRATALHLTTPGTVEVTLTDSGFSPPTVFMQPGQTIVWRNESVSEQAIVHDLGLFDSGPVPSGGAYAVTLTAVGAYAYSSPATAHGGVVYVGATTLEGDPAALANDNIPAFPFAADLEGDFGVHPSLLVPVSRTRIVTGFTPLATVGEANDAITAAGATIVGGLPSFGLLLLIVPRADDFSTLDAALAVLRARPAIDIAAMDVLPEVDVVPEIDTSLTNPDTWEVSAAPPNDTNWWLEETRFPQAWNLLEAARLGAGPAQTLTLITDAGFDVSDSTLDPGHPDLQTLYVPGETPTTTNGLPVAIPEFCIDVLDPRGNCLQERIADHGTHVAGIIGAAMDGAGVTGVNPLARSVGIRTGGLAGVPSDFFAELRNGAGEPFWDELLRFASELEGLGLGKVRVLNHSMGTPAAAAEPFLKQYEKDFPGEGKFRCGAGLLDDGLPGSILPCTWSTLDSVQAERAQWGRVSHRIAVKAAQQNIMIVDSAGNKSARDIDSFCVDGTAPTQTLIANFIWDETKGSIDPETGKPTGKWVDNPSRPATCQNLRQFATYNDGFTYAASIWDDARDGGPSPIIVAEALGKSGGTVLFDNYSNRHEPGTPSLTLSAPGSNIRSTCDPAASLIYCVKQGTSMAAPVITGLIGYLVALDPTLTIGEIRRALEFWSRPVPTAVDAQPMVDAFASALSLDGMARHLVDVNDMSIDGNRRVVLASGGAFLEVDEDFSNRVPSELPIPDGLGKFFTDPDGIIDIRDFRRFRDAWLQTCGEPGADASPTICPSPSDIELNGDPAHAKRDLNFDDCVFDSSRNPQPCTAETIFPRFDFNGDGRISNDSAKAATVPLLANGDPAPGRRQAESMTDLAVLMSQWDAPATPLEGWAASDLPDLMRSSDLELHARPLFDGGASAVRIEIRAFSDSSLIVTRTYLPDADFIVVTVPAQQSMRVDFVATINGAEQTVVHEMAGLFAGADHRLDVCGVTVTAEPFLLQPGAPSSIEAVVTSCFGEAVHGIPVDFSISPSGAGHASIRPRDVSQVTGESGEALSLVTAGTEETRYIVSATARIPDPANPENITTITGEAALVVDGDYFYEIIADTALGTPFTSLGIGPSIRADGAVAFAATTVGQAVGDVYLSTAAGSSVSVLNVSAGAIASLSTPDSDAVLTGLVQLTDGGLVFARVERLDGFPTDPGDPCTSACQVRDWVVRFDAASPGATTVLAKGHSCFLCTEDPDAEFESLGYPVTDNAGGLVIPVGLLDDGTTNVHLALPAGAPPTAIGPPVSFAPADLTRPDRADDGTVVVRAAYVAGADERGIPILDGAIWVGVDVLGTPEAVTVQPIATASQGWPALGARPAISDDGKIIVFLGDRGAGTGVFLSYRGSNGYSAPLWIAGENALVPFPELGVDFVGNPIFLEDVSLNGRAGVSHVDLGAAGLAGDSAVLTFFATPSADGDGFTAQGGLWSVIVDFLPSGVPEQPFVAVPRQPVPLVQLGDLIGGSPVESLGVHDPIANAGTGPGDHRITYWLRAGGRELIFRASWLGGAGATSSSQSLTIELTDDDASTDETQSLATAATSGSAEGFKQLAITSSGVIPAFVVSIAAPAVGQEVTFTNRSRDLSGSPVAASLDPGDGSAVIALAAGASEAHIYGAPGPVTATMTATDASADALAAAIPLLIADNTPPVADVGGPYLLPAGNDLALDGTGSADADLDDSIVEYAWDLDNDGVFEDATGATVDLPWTDVETLVCGGSCAENASYPVALRVTDGFGAADESATLLTVGPPNTPPLADAGGPYVLPFGLDVELDGSGSSDADTEDSIVEYAWDLDDDGVFEDAAGAVLALAWSEVETLVCGGSCVVGVAYPIALRVTDGFDATDESSTTLTIAPANTPPVAVVGGPYVITAGDGAALDGSGSFEDDAIDSIVEYAWDLDGDGLFGDRTGALVDLTWLEVELSVCGGTCTTDLAYPIALRVTDGFDAPNIATTTLTIEPALQDFDLTVEPTSQPINPGGTATFLVQVTSVGGFAGPVSLSMLSLPTGWSASFSPSTVTPNGEANLFVTAPLEAVEGPIPIVVVGTSGDLTHDSTGVSALVGFGLIPECFGFFAGIITDADSGMPLEGARVIAVATLSILATDITGPDGRYLLGPLLATTNVRVQASVGSDYWGESIPLLFVVCDATRDDVDFALKPVKFGSVEGLVLEQGTDLPIAGALVSGRIGLVIADEIGAYSFGPIKLDAGNSPLNVPLFATGEGFWGQEVPVLVDLDGPERVDFHLLRQCTATVLGGTVVDDTGAAVAGSPVTLGDETTITDDGGNFLFDVEVLLGGNNSPIFYPVVAGPPSGFPAGTVPASVVFQVSTCGQIIDGLQLILILPPAPPPRHFGTVIGTVTTADTSLPVADAPVQLFIANGPLSRSTKSDADGRYRFEDVLLGTGGDSEQSFSLRAGAFPNLSFDYWPGVSDVFLLRSGETVTRDLALVPAVRASVVGVVTDVETGDPLAGASIDASGSNNSERAFAGSGGGYRIDGLLTAFPNAEFTSTVTARKSGYWPSTVDALLRPAEVTTVNFSLLERCAGGTIRGIVFDAATLQPLEGAFVRSDRGPGSSASSDFTDAAGRFELAGVGVDFENAPRLATITASKIGFITQTKRVTVYCGASISLDFGQPATALAAIIGTVTDGATGQPIAGVFIGSEFGGQAVTATDGAYRMDDAPLAADGGDRTWQLTAVHPTGIELNAAVTVTSGADAVRDFEFSLLADLSVVKSDGVATVVVGEQLTYLVAVANVGHAAAANVVVTDTLPAGAGFLSATPDQGSCSESAGTVTCELGEIAPGASATVTIVASTSVTGPLVNSVVVASDADSDLANNSATDETTVLDRPDLTVVKSDGLDQAFVGDQLEYVVTVTNSGPSSALDVILIDTLPAGVSFAGYRSDPGQAGCRSAGGTVRCTLFEIDPGESVDVTIFVDALAAGEITNTISVSTDTTERDDTNNTASDQTTILPNSERTADLSILKTDGVDSVDMLQNLSYTLTVSNSGPSTAANPVLMDTLPAGLTFVSASVIRGSCAEAAGVVTCDLFDLAVGATVEVTIVATASATGQIANSASIGSDTPDPDPSNNTSTDRTTVLVIGADLAVVNLSNVSWQLLFDDFSYTITVSNGGPEAAQSVSLSGTLSAGAEILDVFPSQGSCGSGANSLACLLGEIAAGASAEIIVVVEAFELGLITSAATVSSSTFDPDPSNNADSAETRIFEGTPALADLTISKTDAVDSVTEGDGLTYTLTVSNAGPETAVNVVVVDTLPAGVAFVSAAASQGGCVESSGVVTCQIGDIAIDGSVEITIAVTAVAAGIAINTATVSSDAADENPDDNTASDETMINAAPVEQADLSLLKSDGVDTAVEGDRLTYTMTVANAGPSIATNVIVSDALPAGLSFVLASWSQGSCVHDNGTVRCSLGDIPADGSVRVTIIVTTTASGVVTNTVAVGSDTFDPNASNNTDTDATQVLAQADLSIANSDGLEAVDTGELLSYTLMVSNTGPSTALSVVVSDTLPASVAFVSARAGQGGCIESGGVVSCILGAIPRNGSVAVAIVVRTGESGGVITNAASVSSATDDPNTANNDDSDETMVVVVSTTGADLSVVKSDGLETVLVGDPITYTITVSNAGPETAVNTLLTDPLPSGVSFVSASSSQGVCSENSGTVTCALGDIPADAGVTVTIVVDAITEGPLTNVATATSDTSDPNTGNNSASDETIVEAPPVPQADLAVAKSDDVDPVTAGSQLTYTVTVTNAGPDAAGNVVLTDTLPSGVLLVSATPNQGSCSEAAGVVTCNLGAIADDANASVTIEVTTTAAGLLTNDASVSSDTADPNTSNNSTSEDTTVEAAPAPQADLRLTKTDGLTSVTAGSQLIYSVTVTNDGPDPAENVVVTDALPAGVTFVSTSGCTEDSTGVPTCSLGSLASEASVSYTVTVLVDSSATGTLVNSATVSSNTADPNDANDSASDVTTIEAPVPQANLSVLKTDGADAVVEGDSTTYTITVSNAGPSTATNAVLTDTLPSDVSFTSASATQGACIEAAGVVTCELGDIPSGEFVTVTITVTTIDDAELQNSASVSAETLDPQAGNNQDGDGTTVENAAPVVGPIVAPTEPLQLGDPIDMTAGFTDRGVLDTHTAVWDWGDETTSSGSVDQGSGAGLVSGSHVYTTAGSYSVTVTVTDDDGGSGTATFGPVIVADPSGFVTGGGWIDSGKGAISSDPTLTGRATFGFVARYRPGETSPSGSTEFQFAGINFHSTSYDSLVVSESRAEYGGYGTVNGDGTFRFSVTLVDGHEAGRGGGDRIRIRIWDVLTGEMLYDSQPGDPEGAEPTAAVSGGSIVIHVR